jgi:hypothetical protein
MPLSVLATALVEMGNVALNNPAATVTLGGTVRGSTPANETTAPPAGAPAVRITVPVTESPPTTLSALSLIATIETGATGDANHDGRLDGGDRGGAARQ